MITQKELKSILEYDPITGCLIWKVSRGRSKAGNKAGNTHYSGYLTVMYKGKAYQAHRLVWLYHFGAMPDGEIDHVNQIKSDNRVENLRDVGRVLNAKNMPMLSTNKSGCTGVSWVRDKKRWKATIGINGKQTHLGYYRELSDAIKARKHEEVFHGYTPIHGS